MPRLDGFVGLFTQVQGGRDYLMRVPGVARAKLDDARLAAVLNWMLEVYGGDAVAPGFAPYTANEVGAARRQPLTAERAPTRARLIEGLRARGRGPSEDAGLPVTEATGADQTARQIAAP